MRGGVWTFFLHVSLGEFHTKMDIKIGIIVFSQWSMAHIDLYEEYVKFGLK